MMVEYRPCPRLIMKVQWDNTSRPTHITAIKGPPIPGRDEWQIEVQSWLTVSEIAWWPSLCCVFCEQWNGLEVNKKNDTVGLLFLLCSCIWMMAKVVPELEATMSWINKRKANQPLRSEWVCRSTTIDRVRLHLLGRWNEWEVEWKMEWRCGQIKLNTMMSIYLVRALDRWLGYSTYSIAVSVSSQHHLQINSTQSK